MSCDLKEIHHEKTTVRRRICDSLAGNDCDFFEIEEIDQAFFEDACSDWEQSDWQALEQDWKTESASIARDLNEQNGWNR